MDQRVVGALRECDTQEQVEDTFSKFAVSDTGEKTDYILESMGKPEVFYAGVVDIQSAYITNLSAFLTGTWKLYSHDKVQA
jgi:hypothetical protein